MDLKLNLFWIALSIFLRFISAYDNYMDIKMISQVLHDIVDEFLLKEGIKFNIITFNNIY